jgi:hypothetical protein
VLVKWRGAVDEDNGVSTTVLHRARHRPLKAGTARAGVVVAPTAGSHPMGQRTCQACRVRVSSTSSWCPACGKSLQRIHPHERTAIIIGAVVLFVLVVAAAWAIIARR